MAYTFILTLSVSQITCKRRFLKLKTLKTRLRNTINQDDNLEKFTMVSIKKDIFIEMANEEVLNLLGSWNETISKLSLINIIKNVYIQIKLQ